MGCTQSVPEKRRRRSRAKKDPAGNKPRKARGGGDTAPVELSGESDDYAVNTTQRPVMVDDGVDVESADVTTAPVYDPYSRNNNRHPFDQEGEETRRRALEEKYAEQQRQLEIRDRHGSQVLLPETIDEMELHTPQDVPITPQEHPHSPLEEEEEDDAADGAWNIEDIFAATTRGNQVLIRGGVLPASSGDVPDARSAGGSSPLSPPPLEFSKVAPNGSNGGSASSARGSARGRHTVRIYHQDLAAFLEGFDLVRYENPSATSTPETMTPNRLMRGTFSQGSDNIQIIGKNEEVLCDIDVDCHSPNQQGQQGGQDEVMLRVRTVKPSRGPKSPVHTFDAPNGLAATSAGLTAEQLRAMLAELTPRGESGTTTPATEPTGFRQQQPGNPSPRRPKRVPPASTAEQNADSTTQSPSVAADPPGMTSAVFVSAADRIVVDTSTLPNVVEPSDPGASWDLLQSIPNGVDALNAGDILFKFRASPSADLSDDDRRELATFVNLSQFHDEAKENCSAPLDPMDAKAMEGLTLIMVRMMSIYPNVTSRECNVDVITSVDYQKSLVVGKETFETVNRPRTFRKNKTVIPFVYSFIMQMTGSERADATYNRRFADVHCGMVPDRAVILERTKRNMAVVDSTVKSKSVNLYYDIPMPDGRKCTLMSHTSVILKSSMPSVLMKMLKSIGKTTAEEGRKQLLQSRKFLRDRQKSGWELMTAKDE